MEWPKVIGLLILAVILTWAQNHSPGQGTKVIKLELPKQPEIPKPEYTGICETSRTIQCTGKHRWGK